MGGNGTNGNSSTGTGGSGGPGVSNSLKTGSALGYCAGGYGRSSVANGSHGSGGGTAGDGGNQQAAGQGGEVVIRFLTALVSSSTGGTKTTYGAYTVHTFTSSGTFTFTLPLVGLMFLVF